MVRRQGKGFYEYSKDKYERIELSRRRLADEPLRLIAVAVNNASWLISNDVASKEDVEKALILGMGLKEALFTIAERFGYPRIVQMLSKLAESNKFYEPDRYLLNLIK